MKGFFNHLNPAIIKSVMLKMNQEELRECISFIKEQALKLPIGSERDRYIRIFSWSSKLYDEKFKEMSPRYFEGSNLFMRLEVSFECFPLLLSEWNPESPSLPHLP